MSDVKNPLVITDEALGKMSEHDFDVFTQILKDRWKTAVGEAGMSPEKAVERLKQIAGGDSESVHCDADSILLEVLRYLGYDEVADAYDYCQEKTSFWYA